MSTKRRIIVPENMGNENAMCRSQTVKRPDKKSARKISMKSSRSWLAVFTMPK